MAKRTVLPTPCVRAYLDAAAAAAQRAVEKARGAR